MQRSAVKRQRLGDWPPSAWAFLLGSATVVGYTLSGGRLPEPIALLAADVFHGSGWESLASFRMTKGAVVLLFLAGCGGAFHGCARFVETSSGARRLTCLGLAIVLTTALLVTAGWARGEIRRQALRSASGRVDIAVGHNYLDLGERLEVLLISSVDDTQLSTLGSGPPLTRAREGNLVRVVRSDEALEEYVAILEECGFFRLPSVLDYEARLDSFWFFLRIARKGAQHQVMARVDDPGFQRYYRCQERLLAEAGVPEDWREAVEDTRAEESGE